MELTKKQKTIKYVVYCLLILFGSLLQNIGGLWLEIGRARCFFLIPVAVVLGIDEDEKTSALLGFFAGLLWDMISAQHMGFNCIYLMLVCYISSVLVSYIFRNTFWVGAVSAIIAVFVYCLLYWLLFVVAEGSQGSAASFLYFYLPCAVYTSVLTPVLCLLLNPIINKLNNETQID